MKKNIYLYMLIFFIISFITMIKIADKKYKLEIENLTKQTQIIAEEKSKMIESYIRERKGDAKLIQKNQKIIENLNNIENDRELYLKNIEEEFKMYIENYGYDDICLTNENGDKIAGVTETYGVDDIKSDIKKVLKDDEIVFKDMMLENNTNLKYMAIIIPVSSNKIKYGIVLRMLYKSYFEKIINDWPIAEQKTDNKIDIKTRFSKDKDKIKMKNIQNGKLNFIHRISNSNLLIVYNIDINNDYNNIIKDIVLNFVYLILIIIIVYVITLNINLRKEKKIKEEIDASNKIAVEKDTIYKCLIENIEQKIFYKNNKSTYISCNDSYAKDLGIKREEIYGKNDFDFFKFELAEKYRKDDRKVIETKEKVEVYENYEINGENKIIHTIKTPIFDENKNVSGVLGIFEDVTEKMKVENNEKENNETINEILNATPNAIMMESTKDMRVQYINPAFSKLTGYDEKIVGKNLRNFSIWLYAGEGNRVFDEVIEKGEKLNYETILRKKSGEIIFAVVSAIKIKIRKESYVLWNIIDMSELKKVEKELNENEKRLKKAEIIAGIGNWKFNLKTEEVIYSEGAAVIYGLEAQEKNIENFLKIFSEEDLKFLKEKIADMVRTGEKLEKEFKIIRYSDKKNRYVKLIAEYEPAQYSIFGIIVDITEKIEKDIMLNESKNMMAELLIDMEDGVHIIDAATKKTLTANSGMCSIFGITIEDIYNDSEIYFKSIVEDDFEKIKNFYEKIEEEIYLEIFYRVKTEGRIRWVQQRSRAVRGTDNKIERIESIFIDFTKEKEIESELLNAKNRAEESEKIKSAFLANMSHEIRTPMNGIIGMIELMKTTSMQKEQLSYVETIESSANNLLQIINDILDISKIESGKMQEEISEENIRRFITETTTILANSALSKGLDFSINIENDLEGEYRADFGKIRQVLINLIGNAIKFTDRGMVALIVKKEIKEENLWIKFIIKDTGIGISEGAKEVLFKPFEQGDLSYTKKYQGTGLGLAICKKIVELLNGKIEFTSIKGKGSEFFFSVPVEVAKK